MAPTTEPPLSQMPPSPPTGEAAAASQNIARRTRNKKKKKKRSRTKSPITTVPAPASRQQQEDADADADSTSKSTSSPPKYDDILPCRDLTKLYVQTSTYRCALGDAEEGRRPRSPKRPRSRPPCVPCAYKIGCFDVSLDKEVTKSAPNARPEVCPRFLRMLTTEGGVRGGKERRGNGGGFAWAETETTQNKGEGSAPFGYRPGMRVLTVGDGDLSFSLAISRLVLSDDAGDAAINNDIDIGSGDIGRIECGRGGGRVVATSYEDHNTLSRIYPDFDDTLRRLEDAKGRIMQRCDLRSGSKEIGPTKDGRKRSAGESTSPVEVCYNVDGTNLRETLPSSVLMYGSTQKYHRIVWNFPCSAVPGGQDGQNDAMTYNKALVRSFVVNAVPLLDGRCGEIHIAHKTKPPFNQWRLEEVALEGLGERQPGCDERDEGRHFVYLGRIVFDRCAVPPYTPRKALDRKSFPCHDACVYVFGWEDGRRGNGVGKTNEHAGTFPPTIPAAGLAMAEHSEGGGCGDDSNFFRAPQPMTSILPLTKTMVTRLRTTLLRDAAHRQHLTGAGKSNPGGFDGRRKRRKAGIIGGRV